MEKVILEATERVATSGKFREDGFVPGVLYGDGVTGATSVKFKTIALNKIITRHGSNAKLWIKYNNEEKLGFIKETQKHPILGNVTHIDVQIVSKDQEIELQLPIIFKGDDDLRIKGCQLQIHKSDVTVVSKIALLPDAIYVDVSKMELGDSITVKNFDLDKQINVKDNDDEVYAVISNIREQIIKDDDGETADEAEVVETETE